MSALAGEDILTGGFAGGRNRLLCVNVVGGKAVVALVLIGTGGATVKRITSLGTAGGDHLHNDLGMGAECFTGAERQYECPYK